jgi:hypothetical protein
MDHKSDHHSCQDSSSFIIADESRFVIGSLTLSRSQSASGPTSTTSLFSGCMNFA